MQDNSTSKSLIHRWLIAPTDNTFIQLFRYLFVGGTAFLVDFGFLWALHDLLEFHYLVAATISFIAGLTVNYLMSIVWVFNNKTLSNRFMEFVVFSIIGVIGLGLNLLIMWFFTDIVFGNTGYYYLLSKIISTAIVFLWNFFARKVVLFSQKNNAEKKDW